MTDNQEIRHLTELEQLYYLRNFLEECIKNYQQDLDEVKIKIKKLEVNDELDYTVECPNCGNYVNYGNEIFMLSGHIYCSNNGCREKLVKELRYE